MSYTVTTDIHAFVTSSNSREIGVPFTLTCTVTLSHRVRDSSVSIQWQGPSTDEQPTVDRFSDDRVIVTELILGPLMEETTHVLLYTQLMVILLLPGVMWNQLFPSVSYLLSL